MAQSETKALAVAEPKPQLKAGGGIGAIVPQDAESAYRMAQLIMKSGLAPKDMQSPEKIVTAIFHGLELGLKPMQAIQSIAVVNGRPAIWGDAALGLAMGSGLVESIEETIAGDGESMVATCKAKRVGMAAPIVRPFSVADAKKAGLWGKTGPWTQYPRRMLQLRARSWALRDGFADVLKGLHVVEEIRDYSGPTAASHGSTAAEIQAQLTPPAAEALASGDAAGTTAETPPSDWPAWADAFLEEVEGCPIVADVLALQKKHAADLAGMKTEAPEIFANCDGAIRNRIAELKGSK